MSKGSLTTLSVIITNFNYGRYVANAIESLLTQDHPLEIIVVDDCSTDGSRDIISRYAPRITCIFQPVNRGHGAGFNAGFAQSSGDLVMFLDADDFMLPDAARVILANYDPEVAIYHYRMRYSDGEGVLAGVHPPPQIPFARGDISTELRKKGRYLGTVTSGLVFGRKFLQKVLPMDAEAFRQGGDGYLSAVVPLYGQSRTYDAAISAYRLHSAQHSVFNQAYARRARWKLSHNLERYRSIREHSARLGLPVVEDLERRDIENLDEKLASLVFEPDAHPYVGDTIEGLAEDAISVASDGLGGKALLVRRTWWWLMRHSPSPMRRTLLRWRIDQASRPIWLRIFGRFARTRLGVVVR